VLYIQHIAVSVSWDGVLLLLLLLLIVIELSLGGSSPYTSTDKTNKNSDKTNKRSKYSDKGAS
jgi:hypothetical protein